MILLTSFMISWWGNQRSNHVYVSLLLSIWLRGCNYWRLGMTGATHDDRSHVSCPPLMSLDGLWLAKCDHVTWILASDWLVPPLMSLDGLWLAGPLSCLVPLIGWQWSRDQDTGLWLAGPLSWLVMAIANNPPQWPHLGGSVAHLQRCSSKVSSRPIQIHNPKIHT